MRVAGKLRPASWSIFRIMTAQPSDGMPSPRGYPIAVTSYDNRAERNYLYTAAPSAIIR